MSLDFSALRSASGCDDPPSDLALDRLRLGLLDDAAKREVEAHLAGCPDCAARAAQVARGFDAVPDFDERPMLARLQRQRPQRAPWMVGVLALVGVAAAVTLYLRRPVDPEAGLGVGDVRLKATPRCASTASGRVRRRKRC